MAFCPRCGSKHMESFNFCPVCGLRLDTSLDLQYSYLFERRVEQVMPSIIAFVAGTEDGTPRILGTGFGVDPTNSKDRTNTFATCSHVIDPFLEIMEQQKLGKNSEEKVLGVVTLQDNKYVFKPIKDVGILKVKFNKKDIDAVDLGNAEDVGLCIIKEIEVPPLSITTKAIHYGSEVGIIGFPTTEKLQKEYPQPCILKTIISSKTDYPFSRDNDEIISPRIILGCIVAPGFSGGPVVLIESGEIVGMIDYLPCEEDICNVKLLQPKPIEGDAYIRQPAGICLAIPAIMIKLFLETIRLGDLEKPGTSGTFMISRRKNGYAELKKIHKA